MQGLKSHLLLKVPFKTLFDPLGHTDSVQPSCCFKGTFLLLLLLQPWITFSFSLILSNQKKYQTEEVKYPMNGETHDPFTHFTMAKADVNLLNVIILNRAHLIDIFLL